MIHTVIHSSRGEQDLIEIEYLLVQLSLGTRWDELLNG